jgi:phosphosulfolactate phosphohydrolase-like enzyme
MRNVIADRLPKIRADFMPFLVMKKPLRLRRRQHAPHALASPGLVLAGRRAGAAIARTDATLSPPLFLAPIYRKLF